MRAFGATFESLRFRDFRFLWLGTAADNFGYFMQQATLGWVVYDLTGSGTLLGAVLGLRSVCTLFVIPISGIAADYLSRRALILWSHLALLALTLLVTVLVATGQLEIWHLFTYAALAGIPRIMSEPVRQAVVFDLVPREHAPNAVALNTSALSAARAAGPGAAGLLIGWLGAAASFAVQAASYAAVIAGLLRINFPVVQVTRRASWVRESVDVLRYLATEPIPRLLVVLWFIAPLLLIPTGSTLMPVFSKDVFHTGLEGFAVSFTAIGGGCLLGALFTASLRGIDRRGLLGLGSLLVFSGGLIGFAFSPDFRLGVVFLFLTGVAETVFMTTNQTLLHWRPRTRFVAAYRASSRSTECSSRPGPWSQARRSTRWARSLMWSSRRAWREA